MKTIWMVFKAQKHPPYVPVVHVRDSLLTDSEKRQSAVKAWDRAVKHLRSNESRLRTENQIIRGEEHTVWRWVSLEEKR